MKPSEMREQSIEELRDMIRDNAEELLRLRFQIATGVAQNPLRVRTIRREIARAKTILHEQEKS